VRSSRLRLMPRKLIGFRIVAFAVGLIFVLATTDTIQTVGLAFDAMSHFSKTIQDISSTNPTLKKQERENGP